LHRFTQNSGQELWIWWRLEKTPTGNSFYQFHLDIDWHVILLKDAEVMFQGMKFKANSGEPEFKIYAKIIADYTKKWRKTPFLRQMILPFYKRIFKVSFEAHKKELFGELYRFKEAMKTYMQLRTYLPEPEGQKFYYQKDFS
jgi:hypothetical protein